MEKDEVLETTQEYITPELQEKIEAKVAEIRAKDPSLRIIHPIYVEGSEYDDKPYYLGYFREPSFKTFSKYLALSQNDQAVAMRTLANDCFLDGDKELVTDDSLFLFGLMGQLTKIISMRHGKLVNLSKPGK